MKSGSESTETESQSYGVKVVVVGLDDFGGHDSAHEEDGP